MERPRHFELRVIPRTKAIDDVEAALGNALVIVVGGNRPPLSPEKIRNLVWILRNPGRRSPS
jgi:hypothetical protein